MQNQKNCTSKNHDKIESINYCEKSKIYMCKKCENMHSILFPNHNTFNIKENSDQILSGLCQINNHLKTLKYYCKTHNLLCCASCISKIKDNENGQHSECVICNIEEIVEEKKIN